MGYLTSRTQPCNCVTCRFLRHYERAKAHRLRMAKAMIDQRRCTHRPKSRTRA